MAVSLAKELPAAPQRISGDDIRFDLAILQQAYQAMHPGLFRYETPAQVQSSFEEAAVTSKAGASVPQFYLQLAALTAQIQCGHTYPNFFNQEAGVAAAVLSGAQNLPFYFRWIDGKMVVLRDLTPKQGLPVGTQVSKLNDVPTEVVLKRMLPFVRADGANDFKRIALLNVTGEAKWEAFDIFYPIVFQAPVRDFALEVQKPGQKITLLHVMPMTRAQRDSLRSDSAAMPQGNEPVFSKRMLPDNSLLIRMPTWALFNSKWDWKAFLQSAVDQAIVQRSPKLLLDIRGNEGGDDSVGRFLLSRLISRPLVIENYARLVSYQEAPPGLMSYLDTWDKSFLHLGKGASILTSSLPHLPRSPSWYQLGSDNNHAGAEQVSPQGKAYAGTVIVLTDAQNSSATFQFADAVQQNHLGMLLGEPTGGNQRGINGGAFFFLRLPRSRIEVDLPLIGYFAKTERSNAGLTPDRIVRTTARDIASHRDPQLEAALGKLH